ncbi:MAG: hypothetical protein J6S74_01165 [Alphaproteobacteria bacterium]|nr:hypothetical protein [Alphaproteobacteria bacterium]
MFEDAIIVQSALSAFNNAALVAPAFLWSAVLTLPLYVVVWLFGEKIADKVGWNKSNIIGRASLWVAIITFGWVVLFGGNYGVLRDDTSTLPFMVAAIVFVSALFVGSHLQSKQIITRSNLPYIALAVVALVLSDTHTWWGPLLQVGVATAGFVFGRVARSEMRDVPGILLIIMATTTAMLMQPEFFRFGQLGNLTWVHLVFITIVGMCLAATIALRNVKPSNKIHDSAYVKLKWMARFVVMLAVAVFIMTESVPVFLMAELAGFVLFSLSVWHSTNQPDVLSNKLYALTILLFGIIVTMPAICAIGVVTLSLLPRGNLWAESKYLL